MEPARRGLGAALGQQEAWRDAQRGRERRDRFQAGAEASAFELTDEAPPEASSAGEVELRHALPRSKLADVAGELLSDPLAERRVRRAPPDCDVRGRRQGRKGERRFDRERTGHKPDLADRHAAELTILAYFQ